MGCQGGGEVPATRTARMRVKIDTPEARKTYGRRLAIVEPVFANLRHNKRLDRFTYRGLGKVSVQWMLYCLVHNIEKVAHLGKTYGPGRLKTTFAALLRRLFRLMADYEPGVIEFYELPNPRQPFLVSFSGPRTS